MTPQKNVNGEGDNDSSASEKEHKGGEKNKK